MTRWMRLRNVVLGHPNAGVGKALLESKIQSEDIRGFKSSLAYEVCHKKQLDGQHQAVKSLPFNVRHSCRFFITHLKLD